MNAIYAPTAGGYETSEILPKFLREVSPPSAQTSIAKSNKQQVNYSVLLGTTISAMMVAGTAYALQSPTFVGTTQYTAPDRVIFERENSTLYGYKIEGSLLSTINEYLKIKPIADRFVREVARIIDGIYGAGVIRTLRVLDDPDTGRPLMELTIESGLPIDEKFMQNDVALFQQIEASGFAEGLKHVVVSQG
jgi:hypothetical protein